MIDHMSLPVSDYARSKAFYLKALAPLGYGIAMEVPPQQSGGESYVGFGNDRKPYFWLAPSEGPQSHIHVAFVAKDRAAVDAFYRAALAAGGKAMVGRACGHTITRTTTAPSCSTRMVTTSRPSATCRREAFAPLPRCRAKPTG